jgi:hypothetical protein
LAKRSSGVKVVDLDEAMTSYRSMPPHRRVVYLILLLSIKDGARELRFEPDVTQDQEPTLRMLYEVNGELIELVPPPYCLADAIRWELRSIAGFHSTRRRLAALLRRVATRLDGQAEVWPRSRFQARAGGEAVEIGVAIYPSEIGDRVFLELPDCSESLQSRAQAIMGKLSE